MNANAWTRLVVVLAGAVLGGCGAKGIHTAPLLQLIPLPGTLDGQFALSGEQRVDFAADDRGSAVAIDGLGRLIVVGTTDDGDVSRFAVARLEADGTLDTSFGTGGTFAFDFNAGTPPNTAAANAVAIQTDGKIVVVGRADNSGLASQFYVARVGQEGALDTNFGPAGTGRVLFEFGGVFAEATAVAIDGSGRIVVVGFTSSGGSQDMAVARLTSSGNLDTTFGDAATPGKRTLALGLTGTHFNIARAVALDADGQIFLAGHRNNPALLAKTMAVAKLDEDGDVVAAFGGQGFATVDFGGIGDSCEAFGLLLRDDGGIVVAGARNDVGGRRFAIARLKSDGALDLNFGVAGLLDLPDGVLDPIEGVHVSVAEQADGRILLAGTRDGDSAPPDILVARLAEDGTLETGFGNGGFVRADLGASDSARSVVVQADGKIVVAGSTGAEGASAHDFVVLRYLP